MSNLTDNGHLMPHVEVHNASIYPRSDIKSFRHKVVNHDLSQRNISIINNNDEGEDCDTSNDLQTDSIRLFICPDNPTSDMQVGYFPPMENSTADEMQWDASCFPQLESITVDKALQDRSPKTGSRRKRNNARTGKKTRNKIPKPETWKRNKAKLQRMRGEAYVGFRLKDKQESKLIMQDESKDARVMGPTCTSRTCMNTKKRLCNTISQDERQDLFNKFWKNMDWNEKRLFVVSTVRNSKPARKRTQQEESRRSITKTYYLKNRAGENVQVCRKMYLSTLAIGRAVVERWTQFETGNNRVRTENTTPPTENTTADEIQKDASCSQANFSTRYNINQESNSSIEDADPDPHLHSIVLNDSVEQVSNDCKSMDISQLESTIADQAQQDRSPEAGSQKEDNEDNVSNTGKKHRNKNPKPETWKRNMAKLQRMRGEAYVGYRRKDKKETKIILQDSSKNARVMGPACTSRGCMKTKTRLCNTISQDERQDLFNNFWKNMDWNEKKLFVCSTVFISKPARKRTKQQDSRRCTTKTYYLKNREGYNVQVCREMYLNTLGLGRSTLECWTQLFQKLSR